jgi:DNA-binding MarR family transcriptional regulator
MFQIEKSLGFLLAKVHQKGYALFKEQLDQYDLTPQQFALLAFLWLEDDLSQTELSAKTQVDRTTMGGLIDRLEKQELVTRLPNPEDRRAYRIKLTSRGKALEEELCTIARTVTDKFTQSISKEECDTLQRILQKMRD